MSKAKIITDACCHKPNAHIKGSSGKGKSACGVVIIDEYENEHEFSKYLGEMTPPEAEFNGLIFALDKAVGILKRDRDIEVYMDSELVINWINGKYRLKKDHIKPLLDEAKKNANRFRSVEYFQQSRSTPLGIRVDNLAEAEYKKYQP